MRRRGRSRHLGHVGWLKGFLKQANGMSLVPGAYSTLERNKEVQSCPLSATCVPQHMQAPQQ